MLPVYERQLQILIDEKKGDKLRLEEMLMRIGMGKELYNSDKEYIHKIYQEFEENTVVFDEKPFVYEKPKKLEKIQEKILEQPKKLLSRTVRISICASVTCVALMGLVVIYYFY